MKIDQALQQIKINGLQQLNSNNNKVSNNDNSIFSKQLEELMQNMSGQDRSVSVNSSALDSLISSVTSQNDSSSKSGLDNLSLQPDKISRMMELMSSGNSPAGSQNISLANALNIDDGDDSDSSDDSSSGIGDITGGSSDMMKLLQAAMENQNDAEDALNESDGQQNNTTIKSNS